MSGVRNLANAIANDRSFLKETKGLMDAKFADEMVCDPKSPGYSSSGKSAPKARKPGY